MIRALIGLSTYREQACWGVWDQPADLLPTSYAEMVLAAGGVPVLLPPSAPYAECAREVVARLDGLLVTGGADVDPAAYGESPDPKTGAPRTDRDAWEMALLDAAQERRLATLGVCRGMQVMAVRAGGSLDQHLPDLVGHERHSPGRDVFGSTRLRVDPDAGFLADQGGSDVRCHHHQAVRQHPGFTAVAWSDDGIVEAIAQPGDRFCVAVQWHPEVGEGTQVFAALVEAAHVVGSPS